MANLKRSILIIFLFFSSQADAAKEWYEVPVGDYLKIKDGFRMTNTMTVIVRKEKGEVGQQFTSREQLTLNNENDYILVKHNPLTDGFFKLTVLDRTADVEKRNFVSELPTTGSVQRQPMMDRIRDESIGAYLAIHKRFEQNIKYTKTNSSLGITIYRGSYIPYPGELQHEFKVLRVNAEVTIDESLLVPIRYTIVVKYSLINGKVFDLDFTMSCEYGVSEEEDPPREKEDGSTKDTGAAKR